VTTPDTAVENGKKISIWLSEVNGKVEVIAAMSPGEPLEACGPEVEELKKIGEEL
jgi:hypothetical protein